MPEDIAKEDENDNLEAIVKRFHDKPNNGTAANVLTFAMSCRLNDTIKRGSFFSALIAVRDWMAEQDRASAKALLKAIGEGEPLNT